MLMLWPRCCGFVRRQRDDWSQGSGLRPIACRLVRTNTSEAPVPTIRYEQEGQQVGCIEGANLRKASLDAGVNPYNGVNNLNNCGGVGQCGTCVMEVVEGEANLSPRSDVEEVYLADRPSNYRLSCRTTVNGDVTVRTKPSDGAGKGSNSLVGAVKALFGR